MQLDTKCALSMLVSIVRRMTSKHMVTSMYVFQGH